MAATLGGAAHHANVAQFGLPLARQMPEHARAGRLGILAEMQHLQVRDQRLVEHGEPAGLRHVADIIAEKDVAAWLACSVGLAGFDYSAQLVEASMNIANRECDGCHDFTCHQDQRDRPLYLERER